MSAPACACATAICASSGSVASFSTSLALDDAAVAVVVYSHRQTSVMTSSSRHSARIARTARCTMPSSA